MEEQLRNLTMTKCLVVSLVLAGFYYAGAYNDGTALETQIAGMDQQLSANQTEVAAVQKAIQDAERYEKTMAALGKEMEVVLKAIPKDISSVDLMKIISNEAKVVGVEINSLGDSRGNPENSTALYVPVAVDLAIKGTYNQVMLFLSNLTKLDKIINTANLTLTAQSVTTPTQSPSIDLKVLVEAYKYVAPTPAASEGQPAAAAGGDPDA